MLYVIYDLHLGIAFKFNRKIREKNNFFEESVKRIRIGKLVFGHRYMDLKFVFLRLLNKLFTMTRFVKTRHG
jgi:hypothetical protein